MSRLLRLPYRLVQKLDDLDPFFLRLLPSGTKRALLHGSLALLEPLLPRRSTVAGYSVWVPAGHRRRYVLREHEPATRRFIERHLPRGGTAIDVGSNIGYFTLAMAGAVGPRGRVWAVEPVPGNLQILLGNLRRGRVDWVQVLTAAAGRAPEIRRLYTHEGQGLSGFYPRSEPPPSAPLLASAVPLDSVIAPPVDLVKIDVEGAEVEVLDGMRGILAASPNAALVFEWSPGRLIQAQTDPLAPIELLRELGFEVLRLGEDGAMEPLRAGELDEFLDRLRRRPMICRNLCAARPSHPELQARRGASGRPGSDS